MGTVSLNDTLGGVDNVDADVVLTGIHVDMGPGVSYPFAGSPGVPNLLTQGGDFLLTQGGDYILVNQ